MLKTTINTPKAEVPRKPTFPALYHNVLNDGERYVVLFELRGSGTVVASEGGAPYPVGHNSTNWVDCTDTKHWKPFLPGESITITVE